MEHDEFGGVCGTMSELRRDAIIQFITECKKETLKVYAKSMGLSQQGTKLQLALRIYDNANHHTHSVHLPPNGTVSIGIAMSVHTSAG